MMEVLCLIVTKNIYNLEVKGLEQKRTLFFVIENVVLTTGLYQG